MADTDNANGNNNVNNIIITIKDRKLYVPVVTLSARDNQKLSNLLSKGSERSVYWNEYKTKIENKKKNKSIQTFYQIKFCWIQQILVYTNEANNTKRFNVREYYLPKVMIKIYNVITNGKKLL